MKLPEFLEQLEIAEPKQFDTEHELAGWYELGKNEVAVEHLRRLFKLTEENLMQFFITDEDKRDLTKAKLFGAWSVAKEILEKIEQAKKEMRLKTNS